MSLLDKLREAATADPDTDLREFFGLKGTDPFAVTKDGITIGDETVPYAEAMAAMNGQTEPVRRIAVEDLPP